MGTLTIVYPREPGARFDFDYYRDTHLPLVARLWADAGFAGGEALRGIATPDGGEPPFLAIGIIRFETLSVLEAAITGEHAAEILADIDRFTNVEPIVQVNDRIRPGD